jgi:Flp pilus assembly pilin Flp
MLIYIQNVLQNLVQKSEEGQDLAEYAVFIGLIALLVVISITLIGGGISEVFTAITTAIGAGL